MRFLLAIILIIFASSVQATFAHRAVADVNPVANVDSGVHIKSSIAGFDGLILTRSTYPRILSRLPEPAALFILGSGLIVAASAFRRKTETV